MPTDKIDFGLRTKFRELHGEFRYHHDVNLERDKSALVIVDFQPAFFDSKYAIGRANNEMLPKGTAYHEKRCKEIAIPNTRRILDHFREQGRLVVHIVTWSETDDLSDMPPQQKKNIQRWDKVAGEQSYRKWNPGMQVCEDLAPLDHELVVPKQAASAFMSSMLPNILQHAGTETVILCGINTNGCVFETAVGGKNLGFSQILISDATSAFDPWLQELAEAWIERHFAAVHTTDELLDMLK